MLKFLNKGKQQEKSKRREPSQTSNRIEEGNGSRRASGSYRSREEAKRPLLKSAKTAIQNVRRSDSFSNKWTVKERVKRWIDFFLYIRYDFSCEKWFWRNRFVFFISFCSAGSLPGKVQHNLHNEHNSHVQPVFDAGIERKISGAARRLGDDVQHVVLAAKQGNQAKRKNCGGPGETDQWKDHLLEILGGSDEYVQNLQKTEDNGMMAKNDIDILLTYSNCEKFVLRCLENELPPNLIHCMRLLRVLELQMAHSCVASNDDKQNDTSSFYLSDITTSKEATKKVEQLLCTLCSDQSVGEQLRPHLFGLLALSGASYPPNAVHVAHTASNVIVAIQ